MWWETRCYAKSLQSCLTLRNPMDHNPPGSSVHGILQARILEWVSMPSSGESSQTRDGGRQQRPSCQCWSEVTVLFSAATLRNVPVIILFFLLPSSPALQTSFFSPAFSPVPLYLTTLPPHTHEHLIQLILSVNAPTGRQHPRVDRCILLKT